MSCRVGTCLIESVKSNYVYSLSVMSGKYLFGRRCKVKLRMFS